MNIRNRKPLQDKTPKNTPKPPKLYQPGSAKPLPPLQLPHDVHRRHQTVEQTLIKPASAIPKEFEAEILASPSPAKGKKPSGSMHTSPAPIKHHRGICRSPVPRSARHSLATASQAVPRYPSPLPPSSPPSESSVDFNIAPPRHEPEAEEVLAPEIEADDEFEDENLPMPTHPDEAISPAGSNDSTDDPFGMLAAERMLRLQRETRRRAEKGKAKDVLSAPRVRAPLGTLAYASPESESPVKRPLLKRPYSPAVHQFEPEPEPEPIPAARDDDDDEDLYADPYILDSFDQAGPSRIQQEEAGPTAADDDDEEDESTVDKENAPPPPAEPPLPFANEDIPSPPRSPHPHHVDPSLLPLSSPFSSAGTPCDRELAIDSRDSTPSPTKPLQVVTPLKQFRPSVGPPSSALRGRGTVRGRMSFPPWPSSAVRHGTGGNGVGRHSLAGEIRVSRLDLTISSSPRPHPHSRPPHAEPESEHVHDHNIDSGSETETEQIKIGPPGRRGRGGKPVIVSARGRAKRKSEEQPQPETKTKKPRTARKQNNEAEDAGEQDPMVVARNLEKLLPKRPVRKPEAKTTTNVAPSKSKKSKVENIAPAKKSTRVALSKPKLQAAESSFEGESVGSDEGQSEEGTNAGTKRKSPKKRGRPPAKKAKSSTSARPQEDLEEAKPAAPKRGRGRPRKVTTGTSSAPKSKSSKAKGKAKQMIVEDEDSEETRARQTRIEYFKKLDKDYKMAEENVYVV